MIHKIGDKIPNYEKAAFIAWNAEIAGDVTLEKDVSIWFSATLRADIAPILIGEGSNIQDNTAVHIDFDLPTIVGRHVTVGHGAVLHSCTIGDGSLVGMGAILLGGSEIGEECIIGAGSLVTQGKKFPPRSLIIGSPAKAIKTLTDKEIKQIRENAELYIRLAKEAQTNYKEV